MKKLASRILVLLFCIILVHIENSFGKNERVEYLQTKSGLRFAIMGKDTSNPAPTLFILSGTAASSLGDAYFRQCGNQLIEKGFLCVSLDLPCHGSEKYKDEPEGLEGWAFRIKHGQAFVGEFTSKLSEVLDYLVAEKYSDLNRIGACGTSRGGFIALHWAAKEKRIKCVTAFCPVVKLSVLDEFRGLEQQCLVKNTDLDISTDKLADKAIWIVIGDQDTRVDTDSVIKFAREVSRASGKRSCIELHVMPEPRGHETPEAAPHSAALWIERYMQNEKQQH